MREARRLAIIVAAFLLAAGTQVATARADGGGSSSGSGSGSSGSSGSGSGGGSGGGGTSSPCTAPGLTTVPFLQGDVVLGLPFSVDPSTQTLSLQDAVVCTTLPNPQGGMLIDQSVVVPAVDDQGAAPSQGVDCAPNGAATVTAQCSALAQPLVTVSSPTDGANALGLDVSMPVALCVAGTCEGGSPALATAVVTGMLQCTPPPPAKGDVSNQGAVCTWYGAQLTADGVPLSVPSVTPLTAGAWVTPNADEEIGVASLPVDGCDPSADPTTCQPQLEQPWAWVSETGGRVLLLVLPGHRVPVVLPVAVSACVQPSDEDNCQGS